MKIYSTQAGQQSEVRKARRRRENAEKAKKAADKLFPAEKWIEVEDGIYLSSRRFIGKKSNYGNELRDAQILRDLGSTIYLVPENSRRSGKKYDAIVNGLKMEFKNIGGNTNTLEHQFLRSRSQAPNVFINLEKSDLSIREIMSTLFTARNKPRTANSRGYVNYNKYHGGTIILKIKGSDRLIYLNVDNLRVPK